MERITIDPTICSGKPVITGTRIMVRNILSMIKAGYSRERILENYPGITAEDIEAALQFAMDRVDESRKAS